MCVAEQSMRFLARWTGGLKAGTFRALCSAFAMR